MNIRNLFHLLLLVALSTGSNGLAQAAAPKPAKPVRQITPGQVIVPTERMRRIWGELVSVDLEMRTGLFRAENTDELFYFTALPYAEMLHHATFGDLADFKVGERAIFRLHENEKGEWAWLTYIQDEMNMLNGHKEYYFVDSLDTAQGKIGFTQAKGDKSFVREKGLVLQTDAETKFWKGGRPATFAAIKVGDKLRAKTHGIGKGRVRIAWHVFLDDESLEQFRNEQIAVHTRKMTAEGLPGYVDRADGQELDLTLFQEATVLASGVNPGQSIRVAPAGLNRRPNGDPVTGRLLSCERKGKTYQVRLILDEAPDEFEVTGLARLWVQDAESK